MNKQDIKKSFFKKLGIKNRYLIKEINCDICGNKKKKRFFKKNIFVKKQVYQFSLFNVFEVWSSFSEI